MAGATPCPALLLLAALLPAQPAEAPAVGDLGAPIAEWYAGPVRYLMTRREGKQIRRLETDAERLAFVEEFWRRRDPTPETPENEARELFWRRVIDANRLFVETTKAGWKTDRGRTLILLGPPDEREADPVPRHGRPGEIRWIYRNSPVRGGGPNQIIAFRQDRSGEYRISTDPRDYTLTWSFYTTPGLILDPILATSLAPTPTFTRAQLRLDLGRMERPPTEAELLKQVVVVQPETEALPFDSRFDYYRAQDGSTFVAINIGVLPGLLPAGTDPGDLLPVARVESLEGADVYDFVYRNPFVPAPDNDPGRGHLVFQAGQGLPPGRYRALVGLFRGEGGEVASRWHSIDIPEFDDRTFRLSSLALSRLTEPAPPEETGGPYKRPFVLAGRRVVPDLAATFAEGDTFRLYYQIYNAGRDGSAPLALEARYQLFVLEDGGARAVGEPVITGPLPHEVVTYSFPLQGWPPGRYRLRVTVADPVARATASGQVDFRVHE